ncbi:MAG: hypothetical protein LBT04_02490 [Prevotellaceae bacterium]|jgi:acetyl-CoA synthetase|nr:hypothetical protein [Prevotellaceae bacterium]
MKNEKLKPFNFGYDIIDRRAKNFPDQTAVVWHSPNGFALEISNADLHHHSDVTAYYLRRLGVGQGSVIMLYGLEKAFELTTVLTALHKLCAVPAFDLQTEAIKNSNSLEAYSIIANNNSPVIQQVNNNRHQLLTVELLINTGNPCPDYWLDLHTGARMAKTFKPVEKIPKDRTSLIIIDTEPIFFNEKYPLTTTTNYLWDKFYRTMTEGKVFDF